MLLFFILIKNIFHVLCSGGLELLFKKKLHEVEFADKKSTPLKQLLQWMKENLVKERPDLFIQNSTL